MPDTTRQNLRYDVRLEAGSFSFRLSLSWPPCLPSLSVLAFRPSFFCRFPCVLVWPATFVWVWVVVFLFFPHPETLVGLKNDGALWVVFHVPSIFCTPPAFVFVFLLTDFQVCLPFAAFVCRYLYPHHRSHPLSFLAVFVSAV
jgi:hypothetical protein